MKDEQAKPKKTCHQCIHRRSVPGDSHSMCSFSWEQSKHFPPEGNPHGIKKGWWMFPFNYDPIWMMGECKEFNDGREKVKTPHLEEHPRAQVVPASRKTGKTEAMIQGIAIHLRNNEPVGVAGCKDPASILKRLSELGVEAEAKVMSYYREESRDDCYTGYLFKVKPTGPKLIIPDFNPGKMYWHGNEVRYEGNTWVFKPIDKKQNWIQGVYPGTGNGWKIKKS